MPARTQPSTLIDRLLRPFSSVKPGEGKRAALMIVCIFLLFTAYYVMKTAREGLILVGGTFGLRGEELKTYATGVMAVALIGIVPAYDHLVEGLRRIRLINISYAVVLASLAAFYVLGRAGVPLGLAFFIWFGLVSVFLVAQFWCYASDLYDEEQGVRLFAIIAAGGSLGAIAGPRIAKLADTFTLMLIAGAALVGCIALFNVIEHGLKGREVTRGNRPIEGPSGFSLVMNDRTLMLIAGMLLVANLVNTIGEFLLSNAVRVHAMDVMPGDVVGQRELIKAFYSDFYVWVNALGFLIQLLIVSRFMKRIGVQRALFVLPVIAFGAYAAIGLVGGMFLVRAGKILENATDYSVQNTVRQALFLPADRVVKFKAKAAIDTFFVRFGDLIAAVVIGLAIHKLDLRARELAFLNLGLIVAWIGIAASLARTELVAGHRVPVQAPQASQPRLAVAT